MIIFCDGVNTIARKTMGIGFSKKANSMMFGLVYHLSCPDNQMNEYYICFNPDGITKHGYVWVFPNSNALNVGVYLDSNELRKHPHKQNLLETYIESHDTELARLLKGKMIQKKLGAYVPIKPTSSFYADQALVAGDAAGLASALTGGGIHYSLYSGRMAGREACRALDSGNTSSSNLAGYKKGLSGIYKQLLKEYIVFRVSRLGAVFDNHSYPRNFHLYKIRRNLSLINNIRVGAYPLLGRIK